MILMNAKKEKKKKINQVWLVQLCGTMGEVEKEGRNGLCK